MKNISVIIPAFNAENTIIRSIESIRRKESKGCEIVVVDDGSTDNTKSILDPIIEDGTIKYFYKKNGGASSARNYGIEKAQGNYIGFLDADDIFLPGMISKCLAAIQDRSLDLVTVNGFLTYLDENGKKIKTENLDYDWIQQPSNELFLDFMKKGSIGGPHKAIFRREVFIQVGLFDTSLKVYEDLDFWIRVAMADLKWGHISFPLVECYRANHGTLFTSNSEINQDCRVAVLRKYKKAAIAQSLEMKKELGGQLYNFGKNYLVDHNSYKKAFQCFLESFFIDPSLTRYIRSGINYFRNR